MDKIGETEEICPICLDIIPSSLDFPMLSIGSSSSVSSVSKISYNKKVQTIPCKHNYHLFCLKSWTKSSSTCPECRTELKEILLPDTQELIKVDFKKFETLPQENIILQSDILLPSNNSNADEEKLYLKNQKCCLCDSSKKSLFIICPTCSNGYHFNCVGVNRSETWNCPICDEYLDYNSVIHTEKKKDHFSDLRLRIRNSRSKNLMKNSLIDDDNIDYVGLVNKIEESKKEANNRYNIKDNKGNKNNKNTEENKAWKILELVKNGDRQNDNILIDNNDKINKDKNFKRPKCSLRQPKILKLTENALLEHTKLIEKKPLTLGSIEHFELNYQLKLIVQRILLKPKLSKLTLTTEKYTCINKTICHKLYPMIASNSSAINWLNKLQEEAERENVDLNSKRQIDKLLNLNEEKVRWFNDLFENQINKCIIKELSLINKITKNGEPI